MDKDELDAAIIAQIEAVLRDNIAGGFGFERVLKPIWEICECSGWEWFTQGRKKDFNRRCVFLYRSYSYGEYSSKRLKQLIEGSYAYWVYRSSPDCPVMHQELDGLSLPPNHPFWVKWNPPSEVDCSCYIVGASSERMVARLGGQLDKVPPDWTLTVSPMTSQPRSLTGLLLMIRKGNMPLHDG